MGFLELHRETQSQKQQKLVLASGLSQPARSHKMTQNHRVFLVHRMMVPF